MAFLHTFKLIYRRNVLTSLTISSKKAKLITHVHSNFQINKMYIYIRANATNWCSIAQPSWPHQIWSNFSSYYTALRQSRKESAWQIKAPRNNRKVTRHLPLYCEFLCLCSTTASHRVSEGRSWCHANIHVLCQRRQVGESWSHGRKHRGNIL